MKTARTLAPWLALLASFIIWSIFDELARIEACKAMGGYHSHKNIASFECVRERP
jgi:hypothetical protein